MGRTASVVCELTVCFQGKCSISLHDPGRDLLIAFPCGILNDHAVFRIFRFLRCHADTFVIVQFFDGNRSIFLGDVVQTGLGRTLGHPHGTFLSQLIGSPGNSAAVISVCSSEECGLAELFSQLFRGQYIVRDLAHILAGLLRDISCDGVRTSQNFECVQAEAVGLILYIEAF